MVRATRGQVPTRTITPPRAAHVEWAEERAWAGKSVYPFPPVGGHQSDIGAGSASGQPLRKRSTRSGLLMKGRPKAIRSACPAAIAGSAVSWGEPRWPLVGPWNTLRDSARGVGA